MAGERQISQRALTRRDETYESHACEELKPVASVTKVLQHTNAIAKGRCRLELAARWFGRSSGGESMRPGSEIAQPKSGRSREELALSLSSNRWCADHKKHAVDGSIHVGLPYLQNVCISTVRLASSAG